MRPLPASSAARSRNRLSIPALSPAPMTRLFLIAALAAFTSSAGPPALAAGNACEGEMRAASQKYGVPLGVLYSVGLAESGHKESLQPFAMNIAGRAYFATGLADAL